MESSDATQEVSTWANTPDVKRRPKDIEAEKAMTLDLPEDVKVSPSESDLAALTKRIKSYNTLVHKVRKENRVVPKDPTNSAPLPSEYGGQSKLIAIDRDSLPKLVGGEREKSYRMPEVDQYVAEAPDSTHIMPIFVQKGEFSDGVEIMIRDGNHRVTAAVNNPNIPYLLAYVREAEIVDMKNSGIEYRLVESTRPSKD